MTYHWIITILRNGGQTARTREGTVVAFPDETRQKMFYRICDSLNEPQPYAIYHFSLEPNTL